MESDSKNSASWKSNVILLLVVTTLCLIVGELFVRAVLKDRIVMFPRYHTDAQYGEFSIRRLRPDTTFVHSSIDGSWEFQINSKGFRNSNNIEYHKPENTTRVISLGDSHTEGFEVRQEATFSAVIENYLNGEGSKTQVINAGVSGFSTAEELIFLENEGIKYQPDYVVLGFYANDFSDNIKAGIFSLEGENLVVKKYEHLPGIKILNVLYKIPPVRWASENSYLYSFVFNGVWNTAKRLLKTKSQAALQTEYAIPTEKIDAYKEKLAVKLLERMYKFCKKNNIELVILDIPSISQDAPFKSSFPDEMLNAVKSNSDKFIYSRRVLYDYRNVVDIHVPHGHRHISEATHLLYGLKTAKYISNSLSEPAKDIP